MVPGEESALLPCTLRHSLENCASLPSLPTVVRRVIALARDPDVNMQEIVAILSKDPALSARLLSLANTIFYAQQRPVEELHQAVNRIGLERTLSLALGCSLVSTGEGKASFGLNLERYWQRSLICALTAKSLAESFGLHAESGALFTASLLQDIGMLALHAIDTERYQALLDEAATHEQLIALEKRLYDTDHAEIGGWLAQQWQLSERMVSWISHSHDRLELAESYEQKLANCIIASGLLADAWLEGEASLSKAMASLESYFTLETPEMIAKIMTLQEQLPAVATQYHIPPPARLGANELMYEAKLILAEKNARLQQEIEALRQQQEALSLQARLDPLTQLYNRMYLEETLQGLFAEACKTGRPLALVFIDLDHFKSINDHFGHGVGDRVLKGIADILRAMTEKAHFHAGRYGGEEFVVLLSGQDAKGARAFTQTLRHRIGAEPLGKVQGRPLYITASYGIAVHEKASCFEDTDALLNAADKGMYVSKQAGGNRITVFSEAFHPPKG